MMQRIYILLLGLLEFFTLLQWFGCNKLVDRYYFSSLDLKLRLEEAVHTDFDIPLLVAKTFHNKIIGGFIDLFTSVLYYFDLIYLINVLSFMGFAGFCLGLWYLWTRPQKKLAIFITCIIIVLPLIEILVHPNISFAIRIIFLALPLQIISFYGIWKIIEVNKSSSWVSSFILILLLLSIWWLIVFNGNFTLYCLK